MRHDFSKSISTNWIRCRQTGRMNFSRGAVAQLGERLVRNEEASGSIPLSSTSLRALKRATARQASLCNRAKAGRTSSHLAPTYLL